MDWVDVWRDFNAVIAGLALWLVARRYVKYRADWSFQEREALRALIVLLIGALVGSVWASYYDFGWSIGMIPVTIGSLHAIQFSLRAPARYVHPEDEGPSSLDIVERLRKSGR